jgi:hypothetical protein
VRKWHVILSYSCLLKVLVGTLNTYQKLLTRRLDTYLPRGTILLFQLNEAHNIYNTFEKWLRCHKSIRNIASSNSKSVSLPRGGNLSSTFIKELRAAARTYAIKPLIISSSRVSADRMHLFSLNTHNNAINASHNQRPAQRASVPHNKDNSRIN